MLERLLGARSVAERRRLHRDPLLSGSYFTDRHIGGVVKWSSEKMRERLLLAGVDQAGNLKEVGSSNIARALSAVLDLQEETEPAFRRPGEKDTLDPRFGDGLRAELLHRKRVEPLWPRDHFRRRGHASPNALDRTMPRFPQAVGRPESRCRRCQSIYWKRDGRYTATVRRNRLRHRLTTGQLM